MDWWPWDFVQGIEQKMMEPLPGDLVLDPAAAEGRVRPLREGEERDTAMAEVL